jgi:hypothetical protein
MSRPEYCDDAMLDFLDRLAGRENIQPRAYGLYLGDAFPAKLQPPKDPYETSARAQAVVAYWRDARGTTPSWQERPKTRRKL